jgi:hypothetical protein
MGATFSGAVGIGSALLADVDASFAALSLSYFFFGDSVIFSPECRRKFLLSSSGLTFFTTSSLCRCRETLLPAEPALFRVILTLTSLAAQGDAPRTSGSVSMHDGVTR